MAEYFPFPRIAQVARLVRAVRAKGQTRTETVYLITSLTPRQAGPARLLALIRGHWRVEMVPTRCATSSGRAVDR